MLIKSDCGKNLVVESLEEVGVIQYLEKARLGQLVTSPSINKTSIGSIRVDRGYEHQSLKRDIEIIYCRNSNSLLIFFNK